MSHMKYFMQRRKRLLEHMTRLDYSLILITDPSYIFYFTGYHSALGAEWGRPELFVLMQNGESYLITPSMEEEMANAQNDLTKVITLTDDLDNEWSNQLSQLLYRAEC